MSNSFQAPVLQTRNIVLQLRTHGSYPGSTYQYIGDPGQLNLSLPHFLTCKLIKWIIFVKHLLSGFSKNYINKHHEFVFAYRRAWHILSSQWINLRSITYNYNKSFVSYETISLSFNNFTLNTRIIIPILCHRIARTISQLLYKKPV